MEDEGFHSEKKEGNSSQDDGGIGAEDSNRHNQSESDSTRFNGSFYKHFDGPKIRDFEKSTMIKFEEFNGNGSEHLESDPNRKHSERISDRIYESLE